MMIQDLIAGVEESNLGNLMRASGTMFPMVECVHVAALAFVVGSIGMVDLRLLGVSSRDHSILKLSNEVLPWTWAAFVLAVMSGFMLFASNATSYSENPAFQIK